MDIPDLLADDMQTSFDVNNNNNKHFSSFSHTSDESDASRVAAEHGLHAFRKRVDACFECYRSHVKCDTNRPCGRCVRRATPCLPRKYKQQHRRA